MENILISSPRNLSKRFFYLLYFGDLFLLVHDQRMIIGGYDIPSLVIRLNNLI